MSNEKVAVFEESSLDRQTYLDHRKSLVELGVVQMASFDKTLLLLSTGALGLSLFYADTFLEGKVPSQIHLLGSAWGAYVAAMISNLLSYLTAWWDTEIERIALDRKYEQGNLDSSHFNIARWVTIGLNLCALATFVVGTVLLLSFAYINIG